MYWGGVNKIVFVYYIVVVNKKRITLGSDNYTIVFLWYSHISDIKTSKDLDDEMKKNQ